MKNTIAVVDDPLFAEHAASDPHPERPERLDAARSAVSTARLELERERLLPADATDEELARVHSEAYVEALGQAAGGSGYFDPDTYYGPSSVAAARRAAGGATAMARSLLAGDARYGVALLRPPGHHARPGSAMGFCLLNNVAVAAADALANGADRVAIVDWDVHHGNGTQEMFYQDSRVLYVSLHQWPFYPGTGAAGEVGEGDAKGTTVNVPLSAGADDAVYIAAADRLIAPILEQYDPDLLLISAGFDAHVRDPLAQMRMTEGGYAQLVRRLSYALPRGAAGRLGFILEGGYDLLGLESSLRAALEALGSSPEPSTGAPVSPRHGDEIGRAIRAQQQHWRLD